MFVHDRKPVAGLRIAEHDVAPAFQRPDRIAGPVVEIIIQPNPGGRDFLQQRRLDVPVIVETVGDIQLETGRPGMLDRPARQHAVDILADAQGVVDAEQVERVLVGDEQQIGMAHDIGVSRGGLMTASIGALNNALFYLLRAQGYRIG